MFTPEFFATILHVFGLSAGALLIAAGLLHLLPRIGMRAVSTWFERAPGLDVWILYFTVLPQIAGIWLGGLAGFIGSVLGQIAAVVIWTALHELANQDKIKGPRIVSTLNRRVGPVRNHLAVWWTALAVPIFAAIRVAQYFVYPPLVWLVRLPPYKASEWVNVSRHKFDGLVGHDLIWCLYCDWMTGVWSLGSEMLRNVESFWCPIRFRDDKKCANCSVDFPDVAGGWARADGNMGDVVEVLEKQYGGREDHPWFGHPVRLTRDGEPLNKS